MTDLLIDTIGDSWVNADSGRTGTNYGSANRVQIKSGERFGFLLPELPNIAGRTVLDAYLVGHAGTEGLAAQTLTVAPVTERWSPGRVTYTNRPAINSGAAVTEVIASKAAGAEVTVDGLASIIQAVADGTDWYGLRLATNYTTSSQGFVATDSGEPAWELTVVLSDAPEVPENLRPNGGKIGSTARTLAWDFLDLGGDSTEQAEFNVQVDTPAAGVEPDAVSPDYDSGWVTGEDPQYSVPAGPVFSTSESAPTYWRVNVKDGDGNESGWSDWAEFWTDTRPTLVVDSPTGPFGDITPQVLAHLDGGTIKSWEILVTGPQRSDVRHRKAGTGSIDWVIPQKNGDGKRIFRENEVGQIRLTVTPRGDWTAAVGSPIALTTWLNADWDEDAGIDPATNLSVNTVELDSPIRKWSFHRTEDAEAFLFQIDGVTIARVDDLVPDGGWYEWTDSGQVAPLRPHTLSVRAVDGGRSAAVTVDEADPTIKGVWLIPDNTSVGPIVLAGTAVSNFSRTDYRSTYVNGVGEEIDIFYGTPPRTGSFEGSVDRRQDVWETLEQVEALRASKNRKAQLVWGSQSIFVRVRDIDATSADEILPNNLLHTVRFNFVGLD